MAELSTKRANFYKQIYFPSTYYKEVFTLTLEEARDIQEAQRELSKLLIEADTNLARLSETFRERALSPGQQLQVQADRELLGKEAADREKADKFAAAMRRDPVSATGLTKAIADAKIGEGGQTATDADTARRALTAVYREASKYAQSNPAMARRIMADGLRAAEGQGIGFGAVATELNQRVQEIAGQGVTRADLTAKIGSDEDKTQVASFTGGAAAPATPASKQAQARLDALSSPFANGSTEQTARVAAGITDGEDELLRLYLSRLQDKETPGVVTEAELAANPELADAEAVYNRVRTDNSFQKSSAEWYSAEYLSSLKTKSDLERQAKADPFDGLDPYRWSQREALKRGGYTKESLLHLRMLTDRPDLAPYVNPAFARLRAEGGLDPQSAAEATVRAAFEQNPKLTLAELDSILNEKRAALTKQGRQVGREAGALTREAAQERRGAREAANELYATPEAADEAKAYLLALRLNRSGTPATPTVGTEIVASAGPAAARPTGAEAAGADAERARVAATTKAEEDARAAAAAQRREAELADLEKRDREQRSQLDQRARERASTELEGGTLAGSRGAVIESTPDEVDATLQARINTLPPAAQDLLRAAGGLPPFRAAPPARPAGARVAAPARASAPSPAPAAATPPAGTQRPAAAPAPRPVATIESLAVKAAAARKAGDTARAVLIENQIDAIRAREARAAPPPAPPPAPVPAPANTTDDFIRGPDGKLIRNPNKK
jgi:hypothetical protein